MSSEATNELDALIVSNLGDLDAAAHRLQFEIQTHVASAMEQLATEWLAKNEWKGVCDWSGEGIWVAPADWESGEDGWLAKFYLDYGEGDTGGIKPEEDIFWLTRLCHKSRGQCGFRWYNDDGLAMTRPQWKAFLKTNSKVTEDISKKGFAAENTGYFFKTFEVDSEKLAASIKTGDIQDALTPMQKVLDLLAESKSAFDDLLKLAKDDILKRTKNA
jgi:hypothetical protein